MSTLSLEEFSNDSFFVGETLDKQKVLFGEGITSTVGHHASLLGNHALLVSDKGIQAAGHVEKVKRIIEDSGTKVTVFVESIENPTESSVAKCVAVAEKSKIDLSRTVRRLTTVRKPQPRAICGVRSPSFRDAN